MFSKLFWFSHFKESTSPSIASPLYVKLLSTKLACHSKGKIEREKRNLIFKGIFFLT
jgi:hypothetical protein